VLRRQPYCRFDEQTTRFYVAETVLALEYLHLQGYMYRDLKPENILISAQGHIRLSDFDLVRPMVTVAAKAEGEEGETSLLSEERASSFVGTAEYVAPEIIRRKPYTMTAEWWSVGILAYEMVSGYTPFVGRTTAATFRRILGAELKFRGDLPLTKECKAFISGCLQRTPSLRLGNAHGAAELQASRWMRGVEWSLLANTERPPYIPNMPLMPEEREGAGIEDEQRSAAENAAVADRYRLYGRHFLGRGGEGGGGDGVGGGGGGGGGGGDVVDDGNPFAGFDWMASDLVERRREGGAELIPRSETDTPSPPPPQQQQAHAEEEQAAPQVPAAAAAFAAAAAEAAAAVTAGAAADGNGNSDGDGTADAADLPASSSSTVPAAAAAAAAAATAARAVISPIAAETGFDFGVPGCHNLPLKTSSASMSMDDDDDAAAENHDGEEEHQEHQEEGDAGARGAAAATAGSGEQQQDEDADQDQEEEEEEEASVTQVVD
jgi:hypothetical protein